MNIGVFGGTFNPIHTGHLIIAQEILNKKNLDKIIFVPNASPPHKKDSNLIEASLRFRMIELAINDNDCFEIDDYEMHHNGYSYTIDTLNYLQKKYSDDCLFFIIGADSLFEIHLWKDCQNLIKNFNWIIANRSGREISDESLKEIPLPTELIEKLSNSVVETPIIEISSSILRQRIENNKSIKYFVPEQVEKFIKKNYLYK